MLLKKKSIDYKKLTSPDLKTITLSLGFPLPKGSLLSYAVRFEGIVLGLVIFKIDSLDTIHTLHTFYIHPHYHQKGIEIELFDAWEKEHSSSLWITPEEFPKETYKQLTITFSEMGYTLSTNKVAIYWGNDLLKKAYSHIPKRLRTVRPPYQLIDFPLLSPDDFKQMEHYYEKDPLCVKAFLPRYYHHLIDPYTSVILKKEKKVLGWVLNHRTASNHIHYSAYYICPEKRRSILAAKLLYYSVYRHVYQGLQGPGRSGRTYLPLNEELSYFEKVHYFFPHQSVKENWKKT